MCYSSHCPYEHYYTGECRISGRRLNAYPRDAYCQEDRDDKEDECDDSDPRAGSKSF